MTLSIPTLKSLFTMSGNKGAFPDCQNPIMNENRTLTGYICHIEARRPNGPRYNPDQTEEQRDGFENLLLICGFHHPIIDTEYETYTVDILKKMKTDHEQKYIHGVQPSDDIVEKLMKALTKKDKKIYIDMLRSELELCISTLEEKPRLLPVDLWTSAVNSGALTLFKDEELGVLNRVYQKIKDYNHLLTSEHFDRYTWVQLEREEERGTRLPAMTVRRFRSDKASLLDELRALTNVEWLN